MMFGPKRRRVGFTLLELCLVIGVVVTLLVLGYAGYRRVSQASGRLSCINNLRQIGAAILHYSGDHQGLLPGPCVGAQRVYVSGHTLTPGNESSLGRFSRPLFRDFQRSGQPDGSRQGVHLRGGQRRSDGSGALG